MATRNKKSQPSHPFAYNGLDRLIHERARLGVLTSLMPHPKGLLFGDLKQLCGLTDGNLSQHLQVLELAKLVEISKGHKHNRPQTICRITPQGRKRYLDYLAVLEQVVVDALAAAKADLHTNAERLLARTDRFERGYSRARMRMFAMVR